jgi:hypothetical protein
MLQFSAIGQSPASGAQDETAEYVRSEQAGQNGQQGTGNGFQVPPLAVPGYWLLATGYRLPGT